MIVILDNGQRYESHEIRFIDIGSLPIEPVLELLLRFTHEGNSTDDFTPFVHAVVERVEWRSEKSLVPIAALWEKISEHLCMVGRCRDKEVTVLGRGLSYDVLKTQEAQIHGAALDAGGVRVYVCLRRDVRTRPEG